MQTPLIVDKPAADSAPSPARTGSQRSPDMDEGSPRYAARGSNGARELWLESWIDLSTEARRGHHPRSPYVELFWLGVLGPSSTWLIRRLAMRLEEEPDGFSVNTGEIASEIGLGSRQALQAAFDRAFERCCRFGLMQRGRHNTLFVRTRLPDLTSRMAERLPPRLRAAHELWLRRQSPDPTDVDVPVRARHLAMALLACGDEPDSVERQLHAWQFHPAVAFEATHWATEKHTRAQAAVDGATGVGVAGGDSAGAPD